MNFTPSRMAVAVSFALYAISAAHAQTAPAADPNDGLKLDSVIVTGTSERTSKMRSSVSVSTIDSDAITNSNATSAAELLRAIPGIRSESSGGESNANVGVRGLPISAGGARYIQFQEDGLPVLMFGDIAFATADTWIRADGSIDRLEVVRGGSASTLTTGAPGGIINYITKTGQEQGGFFGITQGLGYSQSRQDFGFGGRMSEKTRFYVGGFYRRGDGGRSGASGTENGGQIKGNITRELDNGFIRLSFKHLDDHTPTFMPTPVRFVNGSIQEIPGLDPRRTAFYNAAWPADNTLTGSNGRRNTNVSEGLSAKSTAVGTELDLGLGDGWRVNNKFRWSKNSGQFVGMFPGTDVAPAPAGTTIVGSNAGLPTGTPLTGYTGNMVRIVMFNTTVDDVSTVVNDTKISKSFGFGKDNKLTVTGGLFTSSQNLDITWNFNGYNVTATQSNQRLLNVPGGDANGAPQWGGCCMNYQDSTYRTVAPYVVANWEMGGLSLDGSIRQDRNSARGYFYQGGVNSGTSYSLGSPNTINYSFNKESYSFGGNYRFSSSLAAFGRASKGSAYLADRITFFNDPRVTNGTSSTIPTNNVTQYEGGVKWRQSGLSLFATLFTTKTNEINVDTTTAVIKPVQTGYSSKGLELEAAYRVGGFGINGGLTYTDANVDSSTNAAIVGKTPKRQAKFVYQLTPSYTIANAAFGASIVGTSSSKDDSPAGPVTVTLPAYVAVNAFANYNVTKNLQFSLGINNLFNTIGYTESNDGRGVARSITGRTVRVGAKVLF